MTVLGATGQSSARRLFFHKMVVSATAALTVVAQDCFFNRK